MRFALVLAAALCCCLSGCGGCSPFGPSVVAPAAGPRHVVILREASNVEPVDNGAIVLLQSGDRAKYLSDHKHVLTVLDDELPSATKHIEAAGGKRSALLVYAGDKLLYSGDVPSGEAPVAADAVLSILKSHGG